MSNLPPPVNVSPLIKFFRYAFLASGVTYGALKLQALKALEASRAEEKVKKLEEREIRLAEEKRLAAERDFNQIVDIFKPPPKIDNLHRLITDGDYPEAPVPTSGGPDTNKEYKPSCESSYENLYDESEVGTVCPPNNEASKEDNPENDLLDKPIDLSPANDENAYIIKEFDDLSVLSPEEDDNSCPIPPKN